MNRPFARKSDILWILLLVLLACTGWYYFLYKAPTADRVAHVYHGSREVLLIPLVPHEPKTFTVPGVPAVVLARDDSGAVYFLHSDCPDKICIHSGKLTHVGQSAACLPNRVFVRIEAASPGVKPSQEIVPDVVVGGRGE